MRMYYSNVYVPMAKRYTLIIPMFKKVQKNKEIVEIEAMLKKYKSELIELEREQESLALKENILADMSKD